jgi:hypothetical protein
MTHHGSLVLAAWLLSASPLALAPAMAGEGPALLIHGNYCGPGNNAPRPPVDALDAACARHDACTPDGGLPSPACNARLEAESAWVARDPRQPKGLRDLAGIVSAGAALIPAQVPGRHAAVDGTAGHASGEGGLLRHPELLADTPSVIEGAGDP